MPWIHRSRAQSAWNEVEVWLDRRDITPKPEHGVGDETTTWEHASVSAERQRLNASRFSEASGGHYESWFQRANHPTEPLGFWIRYTVFVPSDPQRTPMGELWAMIFDRAQGEIIARKQEVPLDRCTFGRDGLDVTIGDARLQPGHFEGTIDDVRWSMEFDSPSPPLLMLPEKLYAGGFPRAKTLTGSPLARFRGSIAVGDRQLDIDDWIGSQNHNWGSRHTDRYAWGQVAGFDDAPDVFLECATAWLKFGPLWTPPLTVVSVRVGEQTIQRVTPWQALRARARLDPFSWRFTSVGGGVHIEAQFEAEPRDFVALRYLNPPSGSKVCVNSKVAGCRLTLEQPGTPVRRYRTAHRAAFEILQDSPPEGMTLQF